MFSFFKFVNFQCLSICYCHIFILDIIPSVYTLLRPYQLIFQKGATIKVRVFVSLHFPFQNSVCCLTFCPDRCCEFSLCFHLSRLPFLPLTAWAAAVPVLPLLFSLKLPSSHFTFPVVQTLPPAVKLSLFLDLVFLHHAVLSSLLLLYNYIFLNSCCSVGLQLSSVL